MKKSFLLLFVFILLLSSLFSYSNNQKLYSFGDKVLEDINTLYTLEGLTIPSSFYPISEDELLLQMKKFDKDSLSGVSQEMYKSIMNTLTSGPKFKLFNENFALDLCLSNPLELYVHTNNKDFKDVDDWYYSFDKRKSPLKVSIELFTAKSFYGYFEVTLGNSIGYNTSYHLSGKSLGGEENHIYRDFVNINIPFFNDLIFRSAPMVKGEGKIPGSDFDLAMPYKALFSIGGKNWNLALGRDKISFGEGTEGNLLLSSSFPRHTFLRFTTYFKSFKYTLLTSVFPSPDALEDTYASLDGYKALMVHSIEFTLLKDRLRLSLTDALTFWSKKNQNFFFLQINPFGFFTGESMNSNSNSLLLLEASFTPKKTLNIYSQVALDELSIFSSSKKTPPAFGLLCGVKAEEELYKGVLSGNIEGVYTSPFLYIRGANKNGGLDSSGYGFEAFFRSVTPKSTPLTRLSLGYPAGNDVISITIKLKYEEREKYSLSFKSIFVIKGSMDLNSAWNIYDGDYKDAPKVNTPTTFNPFSDYDPNTGNITQHEIEEKIILSFRGEYYILKSLLVYAKVDPIFVWNQKNVKKDLTSDLQFTLGIEFSL